MLSIHVSKIDEEKGIDNTSNSINKKKSNDAKLAKIRSKGQISKNTRSERYSKQGAKANEEKQAESEKIEKPGVIQTLLRKTKFNK